MLLAVPSSTHHKRFLLICGVFFSGLFASTLVAHAQLKSGPEAGTEVKGFKAVAVTGELAKDPAEEIDYLKERKGKTTVFLFVSASEFQRPIGRYMSTLDKAITAGIEGVDGVEAVAVWLTDDVAKSKEYLPKAQGSLKFGHTALSVFPGQKQGPEGWGLDIDAHLTTVIVRDGKVVASFGYRSTNETDVREVVAAIKKK